MSLSARTQGGDALSLISFDGNVKIDDIWNGKDCTLATQGVTDNRWHHVAFVVDSQGGRLYVDGNETASKLWKGSAGAPSTLKPLDLGRYPGTSTPFLPGRLDDVRIYSRALDTDEIRDLSLNSGGRVR